MALRKIRLEGDPVLKQKTARVTKFSRHLHQLLEDMIETMFANEGAGLAAPQVGISKSIIVLRDEEQVLEVINPEIISSAGEITELEGCLSLPGIYGEVARFEQVGVRGFNRWGKEIQFKAMGFPARVFQHEIDHLQGILFVNRAKRLLTPEEVKQIMGKNGNAE
ncbi:MAG: peptide deformylase [Dethiobacteria bacterium]|jgi:peptide deformylase